MSKQKNVKNKAEYDTLDNLKTDYIIIKSLGLGDAKNVPLFNKNGERIAAKVKVHK